MVFDIAQVKKMDLGLIRWDSADFMMYLAIQNVDFTWETDYLGSFLKNQTCRSKSSKTWV